MRIKTVFMGTPDFAAVSLRALCDAEWLVDVAAVVTQPDKPQGRGNQMIFSPVKKIAVERGIPVFQPRRAEEIVAELTAIAPDFITVVAFGQILKRSILDLPKKSCINVHASLLPAYRGAAPINWAIINGEVETGVTTMLIDEKLDSGDMLLTAKTLISSDDTAETLHDRLAEMGAGLLVETLRQFDNITPVKQDDSKATYYAKMTKDTGRIDWTRSGAQIRDLVRGCSPWPGAFTFHNGNMIKVWGVELLEATSAEAPGTVLGLGGGGIEVAVGGGAVLVTEVQREGKKRQSAETFLRGYKLGEGEKIG